jgi:hypothetical protein
VVERQEREYLANLAARGTAGGEIELFSGPRT